MNEKTVGALAKFTGVSVHTIKYYEKMGLLASQRKENSNYRSYDVRVCTDIYECVKYRNMGFSVKDTKELLSVADDACLEMLLEKRRQELTEEIERLGRQQEMISNYLREIQTEEKKIGKWYIEDCPELYFRSQTEALTYAEEAGMVSDGVNLTDYAPRAKSVVWLDQEYLANGGDSFSWGQGILMRPDEDWMEGKKGFRHQPAGRAFVMYVCMTGRYVSDGRLAEEIRRVYREYREELPPGDGYGVRIKITHDEEGNDWNYLKIVIPLTGK